MKMASDGNFSLDLRLEQFRYAYCYPTSKGLKRCSFLYKYNELIEEQNQIRLQSIKNTSKMKLTKRQFDLLIDGLSTLESKEGKDSLMTAMLGSILMPPDVDRKEFLDEKKREMELQSIESQSLKKEIIIIKARLYEAESELVDFGSEILQEK